MVSSSSNVVSLHSFWTTENLATVITNHYLGIDPQTQRLIRVVGDDGDVIEEVRVANADLAEIAQKFAESRAALEAGGNYDRLDEELDVTLANPAKADWLEEPQTE